MLNIVGDLTLKQKIKANNLLSALINLIVVILRFQCELLKFTTASRLDSISEVLSQSSVSPVIDNPVIFLLWASVFSTVH